jgi:hypothetical protein
MRPEIAWLNAFHFKRSYRDPSSDDSTDRQFSVVEPIRGPIRRPVPLSQRLTSWRAIGGPRRRRNAIAKNVIGHKWPG